jgi:hypothetical protein
MEQQTRGQSLVTPTVPLLGVEFKSPAPLQDYELTPLAYQEWLESSPKHQMTFEEYRKWADDIGLIRRPRPTERQKKKEALDSRYEKLDAKATRKEFERINRLLTSLCGKHVVTLDMVIPALSEMQCLLSQRGDKRRQAELQKANLPKWSPFIKKYADQFGVTVKTLRNRIAAHRGVTLKDGERNRPKAKPVIMSAKDARQSLKGNHVAGEIVSAIRNGQPIDDLLALWDEVAITPEKTLAVLEGIEDEPHEQMFARVIAAFLRYSRAADDALYYATDVSGERRARLVTYREQWRKLVPSAGFSYTLAKKLIEQTEG